MADSRRNPAVDTLRTLAILGMMAAHTSRLIALESRQEWSYWTLLLEPVIPSLFLFLVGVSLTYSLAKSKNPWTWYFRKTRRAMGLWLVSALFFALDEGPRLPDVFIASGILCTIAYSILSVGAVLLMPRNTLSLGLLFGLGSLAFVFLDRSGMNPFLLTSGNSPLFPLWLFAVAGALWGLAMHRVPRITRFIGFLSLVLAIWMLNRSGLETLFTYPLGRSDATRVLVAPIMGGGIAKTVAYYNLRPMLYLFCLSIHVAALGLVPVLLSRLKSVWAQYLFILGRHSLQSYILHLFLLAILVVSFGPRPLKTAWQGNLVLAGVVFICFCWAFLLEKSDLFKKLKLFRSK